MPDLDERLRSFVAGSSPDPWDDIAHRNPRLAIDARPISRRRLATAIAALAVAAGGLAFAVRAFSWAPIEQPSPDAPVGKATRVLSGAVVTGATEVAEFPNAVAVGEGGVWVSAPADDGSGAGDVVRLDPSTGKIVAQIPVDGLPTWETGGGGMATGLGSVWVSGNIFDGGGPGRAIVSQIDPVTNRVADVIDLGPAYNSDVAIDASAIWALVFTRDHESLEVVRVDPATHEEVARIPIEGIWSQEIFVGEGAVWVNAAQPHPKYEDTVGASRLTRIDPATNEVTLTLPGVDYVESTDPSDGVVWAWTHEGLVRLDAATGEPASDVVLTVRRGWALGLEEPVLVDGANAWFYGFADDSGSWVLSALDAATGEVAASAELGPDTQDNRWWIVAAAVDPPNETAWVVHYRDKVSRIEFR